MSNSAKRRIIAFVLLSITAFVTFGAYSEKSYSGFLYTRNVPMIIGDWYGRDVPMDERTYEILETRDAFTREYTNARGEKVMLTVVFARSNRKVAHPPEVCLAGGGWARNDRGTQTVQVENRTLKFNRIVLQKGSEKRLFLYLYKAGHNLSTNYYAQQFNIIINGLLFKNTSSALIELSCFAGDSALEASVKLLSRFAGEAIPVLEEYLP